MVREWDGEGDSGWKLEDDWRRERREREGFEEMRERDGKKKGRGRWLAGVGVMLKVKRWNMRGLRKEARAET